MTHAPVIDIRQLVKHYPGAERPAVDGISLQIPPGRIFGLLGPNGAGKTTLLSMICGLLHPDSGELRVLDHDIRRGVGAIKRGLGLVPQDLALYPTLTARENLAFFGAMQGLTGARLDERIQACLAVAKLEDLAGRRVETFSGGLKRRLNLAIGLLHEPRLLILDEPTVGIDPQSRNFIHHSLRTLNARGMTIIYTTHYMEEVEQLCNEIAIIDHGHIIAQGSLETLLGRHSGGDILMRLRENAPPALTEHLQRLPLVKSLVVTDKALQLTSDNPQAALAVALEAVHAHHGEVLGLTMGAANLEQVFLQLTGTRLRD